MSDDTGPSPENIRTIQAWLTHLDARSEEEPQAVLDSTQDALHLLATWESSDAYAWALALRAKAFRLLDSLPEVLITTEAGLNALDGDEQVAAHLHLEAGMALTQFGRTTEAVEHLQEADRIFEATDDKSGRAWALVSLAEAIEGSDLHKDPETLLKIAVDLANTSGDVRAERRAWKQLAVTYRHRGKPAQAIDAIWRALVGDMSDHTRANYQLELGHLMAWTGDYAGSDSAYEDALVAYVDHSDYLGQANVERALATNALLLGRHTQGAKRLNRAAELYRRINSKTGLGYVLRERAILRLILDDREGALSDIKEGLSCFRTTSDTFGLSSILNAAVRVRHTVGDSPGAQQAFNEARSMLDSNANPLSKAGILLLQAEISDSATTRLDSSQRSAYLYGEMGISTGEALALSRLAMAYTDLGKLDCARSAAVSAIEVLRRARKQVADPGRRGDHDFALRDVTSNLLTTSVHLNDAIMLADLIIDEAPVGLRRAFHDGHLDVVSNDFLARLKVAQPPILASTIRRASLIQQINARISFIDPNEAPIWTSFQALASAHPKDIVIAFGSPTSDRKLPVAWQLPGESPQSRLAPLDDISIEQIDALGQVFDADQSHLLWVTQDRSWQTDLTRALIPLPVLEHLSRKEPVSIAALFPSVLAHIPFEALIFNGQPVGIRAAVVRLTVPTTAKVEPILKQTVAYLDPELSWAPERRALKTFSHEPNRFRSLLGPDRLIFIGCHGETAFRAEGALVASDGSRVIDALDLLARPLSNSIVVIAACNAGRYMGPRTGEQLHLATLSLLAGASSSIAGLFALPSNDLCTGIITSTLICELEAGVPAPEALRRAREAYWLQRPSILPVPGQLEVSMSGDAPWAWAGLCAYAR